MPLACCLFEPFRRRLFALAHTTPVDAHDAHVKTGQRVVAIGCLLEILYSSIIITLHTGAVGIHHAKVVKCQRTPLPRRLFIPLDCFLDIFIHATAGFQTVAIVALCMRILQLVGSSLVQRDSLLLRCALWEHKLGLARQFAQHPIHKSRLGH